MLYILCIIENKIYLCIQEEGGNFMSQDMDFALYFNIAFFSALALGVLFGFLKGLKKSMWGFILTLIFYAVFFLTITQAVNLLWSVNLPFLGSTLGGIMPSLSGVTSLQEALPLLLAELLPVELQSTLTNVHFLELVSSLAIFVVKIIYTILYFTVIQILYRLIFWIVRMIIFPSKKKTERYKSKNRGIGALFGLMSGGISLYVTLIIFGGLISISESLLTALPAPEATPMAQIEYTNQFDIPTDSIIPLVDVSGLVGNQTVEEAFGFLNDLVDGYNENIIVTAQSQLTMTSPNSGEEMPLNLYLFDSVLSMDYQDEQIAIREELSIYSNVASNVLESEFLSTSDIGDLTSAEIRGVFTDLSKSNLFTSILPIGVEIGADFFDTEIDIPTDELYEIDWEKEIVQLGGIAATVLDIVNAAGILNDQMDLNTITLDGDEIEALFVELGKSSLVTLAAYVAIAPVLEMAGAEVSAIITVPENINWTNEFAAIGAVAGEILNTNLTIGDFQEVDAMALLSSFSEVNFLVLLRSQIITNAMINILSGDAFSEQLSFLNIPDDIVWLDELNSDGDILVNGELRNILLAINALAGDLDSFDLENMDINFIADLDPDNINALFESKILVATITQYITELDLGDQFTIIMPDSVFDEVDGYLLKSELQNVVAAVHMIVTELVCPVGDDECAELGFNVAGMLALSGDNIDILLTSDILAATVGNLILEMGGDVLTVPGSALTTIKVDKVDMDVVSKQEIKSAFLAISVLGIDDINNIEVDASILTNLALEDDSTTLDPDKAELLFASMVINATLSSYIIEFAEGEGAIVVVPYLAEDGTVIREIDALDGTEYITEVELTNILEGVLALDISDFNNIETLDLSLILDNVSALLESSILHATVSKQLLNLTDVIKVPASTIVTTGPVGLTTDFILKTELQATFDALEVLGITDINNVAIDISILNNLAVEGQPTVLDTTKSDLLFGSTIINATLSKYLIDFTEGDAAMVVVPYIAEDDSVIRTVEADGTNIISETELTNILKAVLILDIQDFETIDTLDLDVIIDNVAILLDSSILHATVSKQLLDLTDVIKVPASTVINKGPVGDEVDFILKAELQATFDALSVLGITDINNVTIDISILNNLAEDGNPTILDTAKSDILFGSVIINATLSKYLIDFTEGDAALVIVPYIAEDDSVIRTVEADGTNIISEIELTNILKAVLILDIQDFETIDTLDLDVIIDNVAILLDSSILHATVTKQLLDLTDVIKVPASTVVTKGPVGDEVDFILKVELEATFDALSVLGITDINNVAIDITILNNLAEDDDSTVLDTAKSDILFGSVIINATLSKYLIDFTEGDSALVIVPYIAEDDSVIRTVEADGTNIISETELTNILKAVLILDIQDFEAIDTLDLGVITANVETLLDSSILHATVAKQLLDLTDVIKVPASTVVTKGPVGDEVDFIFRAELIATFKALEVLGITDINNVAIDITILNNLAEDGDPTALDTAKSDILFGSIIINATLSKYLIDFTEGDSAIIVVPYLAEDNTVVRTVEADGTNIISEAELTSILTAVLVLDIDDFNAVDTLDLNVIIDNVDVLLDSSILHATISKQLFDLGSEIITVPYKSEIDGDVRVTVGAGDQETEYITKLELEATFDALELLGITDVNNFSGDIDFGTILGTPGNVDILLTSSIIQATISDQVINLTDDGGDSLLAVPFKDELNVDIRITVGGVGEETEYIKKTEIKAVFDALDLLGITDVNSFSGDIDFGTIIGTPGNVDILLESAIIQATISDQVINLTDDGGDSLLAVPFKDELNGDIRITVGDVGEETEYIVKTEIKAVFDALDLLGITDVNSFSGDIDFGTILGTPGNVDILLESAIIQATISDQVINLTDDGGDSLLAVPFKDELNGVIRITVGGVGEETEYIKKTEIKAVFDALDLLGITDVNNFDGNIDFGTILGTPGNVDILLESAIIQATISDQVINLTDDGGDSLLAVPFKDELNGDIRITVGGVGEETEYIIKAEIKAIFDALDVLGVTDINNFDGSIDFGSILSTPGNVDILLESAVIHATISDQVINLTDGGGDSIMVVPFRAENNITLVRLTVGDVGKETEYIVKTEIKAIFDALDVLGITDIENFSGSVDLGLLSDDATVDTVLLSSVIQATISKQLIDLDDGLTIIVPYYREDNLTEVRVTTGPLGDETEYVVKTELEAIFDALDVLGITDVETFGGNDDLDLGLLAEGNNADIVLASAMVQAIISRQVIDLDDLTDAVIVPYMADDNITEIRIDADAGLTTTNYVKVTELKALVLSLDVLNMTDVNDFGGSIDLDLLTEEATINQVLSSSILQATISEQIINLGDDETLIIPFVTEDSLTTIRVTTGPLGFETEFITSIEIKAIIDALDVLGIADVETFGGTIDLSLLSDDATKNTVLASSVIQATISKQLINLDDVDGAIIVPYYQEDTTTAVRIEVGPVGFETVYIAKIELSDMFTALDILGLSDVGDFGNDDIDFSIFATGNNAEVIIESVIIQATVSKQILDLDVSGTIEVPYMADDGTTPIRVTVGPVGNTDELVVAAELEATIIALDILNVTDPSAYNGAVDLSLFYDVASRNTLLASSTMQATISEQIIGLGAAITVPVKQDDGLTDVRKTVGALGFQTEYIMKTEIHALFEALEILGMDEIDDFSGTISLNTFLPSVTVEYDANQNILLGSASIQATISEQILDLQTSGFVIVPTTDVTDTAVQVLVSGTDYIYVNEIKLLINAMDLLGVTDITNFDGNLGLAPLLQSQDAQYDSNQDIMLDSAIMHATITDQVAALDGGAIVLPSYDVLGAAVQLTVSTNEFIAKLEIKSLINAMDLLGFSGNLGGFGGDVNLTTLYSGPNQETLLKSAIMHATITDQISGLDGGAIVLPSTDVLGAAVQLTVLTNDFITKLEIKSLLNALEVLGIGGNLNEFGGAVNLSNLYTTQNQDTLLTSAIMHATISDQITGLDGGAIVLPTTDVLDNPVQLTISTNDFITKLEIKSLLNALEVLGIGGNLNEFGGDVNLTTLYSGPNQETLLTSAIMHATITDQITGLDGGAIVLPSTDVLGNLVQLTVSTNDFITKLEIKSLLNALEVLGIGGNLNEFGGAVNLSNLYTTQNQDTLLTSAIMHATITDQITGLDGGAIVLPSTDVLGNLVQLTVSTNNFITKLEIKSLLNALEVLGIGGNLAAFDGSIGLTALFASSEPVDYQVNQDTVLLSAIMHRTITDQISDLGATVLVVPGTDIDGTDIDVVVSTNFFVNKTEIKHLFDAMDILGVGGNLAAFDGSIDLTAIALPASQNILLLSAIMHATLSDKLINTTLDIPDVDINRAVIIRVTQSTVEFIEKTEMKALLVSLDLLGLTNFNSMGLDISNIYGQDMNILLASATLQATISGEILPTADTYTLATPGDFIVPVALREDIAINTVGSKWIDKTELINLIEAFDTMGLSGFGVTLSGSSLSGYSQTDIHKILESVSMHLTVEKMIKDNGNINTFIPDVTGQVIIIDSYYLVTDIVHVDEVERFILAINVLGGDIGGDVTSSALGLLTYADQQTVLSSYIARCKLTPELVTVMAINLTPYSPTDYESVEIGSPVCLKYTSAILALALL